MKLVSNRPCNFNLNRDLRFGPIAKIPVTTMRIPMKARLANFTTFLLSLTALHAAPPLSFLPYGTSR